MVKIKMDNCWSHDNAGNGFDLGISSETELENCLSEYNGGHGYSVGGKYNKFKNCEARNNYGDGFSINSNNIFGDIVDELRRHGTCIDELHSMVNEFRILNDRSKRSDWKSSYERLLQVAANHMTVLAPFLPALQDHLSH